MVDDAKISFTAGKAIDSRAPRIIQLTGGRGTNFGKFESMYKDSTTAKNLINTQNVDTKIIITDIGSDQAPGI